MLVSCPHCLCVVEIVEINCRIFRHGVFIATGVQIPPHLPKRMCDHLANNGQIYGCGKPFQLVLENEQWVAVVCDYV